MDFLDMLRIYLILLVIDLVIFIYGLIEWHFWARQLKKTDAEQQLGDGQTREQIIKKKYYYKKLVKRSFWAWVIIFVIFCFIAIFSSCC